MTTQQILQQLSNTFGQQNSTNQETLSLLRKIAENSGHQNLSGELSVAVIAGLIVLLLTSLFQYLTSLSQNKTEIKKLRVNLVTAERLRWLQDLRIRLSNLYSQMDMQYSLLKRTNQTITQADLDKLFQEIMKQCNIITLMLNPKEQNQMALREAINSALSLL